MTSSSGGLVAASTRALALLLTAGLVMALAPPAPPLAAQQSCPPAAFVDRMAIPESHRGNVDCAVSEGVVDGYSDRTYRPTVSVRRDQMASFLARALDAAEVDLPPSGAEGFDDTDGNVHADNIARLADAGIVEGFPDGRYRPRDVVRRDQIASYLLRALAYAHGRDVEQLQGGGSPFSDIAGNFHRLNIEGSYQVRLVEGRSATTYVPRAGVRRDQMASLAMRALVAFRSEPDRREQPADAEHSQASEPVGRHTASEHVVAGSDGTPLAVTVHRPAHAGAERPAPVILHSHGWAGSRSRSSEAFAAELDRGFGVVSFDQRGHGDSGGKAHVQDPDLEGWDTLAVVDFVASLDWVATNRDEDGRPVDGDPVLFAMGGSYGGAYQLVAALTERAATGRTRFDALAPEITWFDLSESLAPQKVVRSAWAAALYGAGAPMLADYIHSAFAWGISSGQWPDADAPPGVHNLDEEFTRHSPAGFVADGVRLDVPVLIGQGATDNLFNLNEGWHNFERTLTDAARAASVFIGYNGGHELPTVLPAGQPSPTQAGTTVDPCSGTEGFAGLRLRFFEAVLADDNPRELTGSAYRLATAAGDCLATERLDDYRAVALDGGLVVGTDTITGVSPPRHVELVRGPVSLAGVPQLSASVTTVGVDQRAFFALSVGTSPATATVVQHNVMPLREAEPVAEVRRTIELPGVAVEVPDGHRLYLTVSATSDVFAAHGSTRTPGLMTLNDVRVDLPMVR